MQESKDSIRNQDNRDRFHFGKSRKTKKHQGIKRNLPPGIVSVVPRSGTNMMLPESRSPRLPTKSRCAQSQTHSVLIPPSSDFTPRLLRIPRRAREFRTRVRELCAAPVIAAPRPRIPRPRDTILGRIKKIKRNLPLEIASVVIPGTV